MVRLEIHQFPCLDDNYGVLVHDPEAKVTASIDAPEDDEIGAALASKGWTLSHILTTHHHHDHTGGNLALKAQTGCDVIGPRQEAARIPGIDRAVGEGETIALGGFQVHVIETPGHTSGAVSYWIPTAGVVFCGDTLFAMGCGRLFEGTPQMMWRSLKKLMDLPPATRIYCGHEYTLANARFALSIDPDNPALIERLEECQRLRAEGRPTLPTRLDIELETNPFLRVSDPGIRRRLGMEDAEDWQVFAEIRERKNRG